MVGSGARRPEGAVWDLCPWAVGCRAEWVMQCFIPLLAVWTGAQQSWVQVLPLPLLSLFSPRS